MAKILLLETSGTILSVALASDGAVIADRVCREPRMQASLTAPLVKEVLDAAGIGPKELDAVCVSKGPGSYTGLRVGTSTAKGLCFGAGVPLIAVSTLDILSVIPDLIGNLTAIVPMIDARRMEVYTAVYSPAGERLTDIEAKVIGPESFAEELAAGPVLFIGDGALKCQAVLNSPNAFFREAFPLASAMAPLAEKAYKEKQFEDLAYFEPFYLKEFVATLPRKNLL
ncbi:MAG: tRNA (adenosine(37)-N6)-threonylcarbamoyltransferase complex dimerization subunit type 1 TsaB [Bacteroidales bacterium]|nr:tRNA (adenosine(37)-N6)-threonylcarbamoyltransferase complex dimerization subunit type 1 TsaB [Bacteroidales bacterium]